MDGTIATADEEYLAESILDPGAKVVQGYQAGIMPQYDLTDTEIEDIVSYLATLK